MRLRDNPAVIAAASTWSRLWTPPVIALGAVLSVVISVLTVDVFGRYLVSHKTTPPAVQAFLGHAASVFFLLLTTVVVFGAILSAFRRGDTRALLTTVFVSYFSLMLVFTSVYYAAAFQGDLEDAIFKYENYRHDGLNNIAGPVYESRRAFYGIEPRFWSGVDWPVRAGTFPNGLPPGAYRVDPSEMRRVAATYGMPAVIQFVPEARLEIFADCLYLSVITMTTTGYGDITPRSLSARIAAAVEAVCNTVLLIFGVGIILGSKRASP